MNTDKTNALSKSNNQQRTTNNEFDTRYLGLARKHVINAQPKTNNQQRLSRAIRETITTILLAWLMK